MAADPQQQQIQRAFHLLKQGQREEAYALLRPVVQENPRNADAWWLIANTVTNPDHIRTALNNVLGLNPNHAGAQQMLARLDKSAAAAQTNPAVPAPPTQQPATAAFNTSTSGTLGSVDASPSRESRASSGNTLAVGALLLSTLLAIIGGVVGAGAWVLIVILTERQFAYAAVLVGALIGFLASLGVGRRRNIIMAIVAAVVTLFSMAMAEYFIVRHFAIIFNNLDPAEAPLLLGPVDIIEIIGESVSSDPLTLLFWGLALLTAFSVPMGWGRRRR